MVGPRPARGAPYGGAEWPASPRRWRGTCGDGARAPRVPASRPASPGDHGAPGARVDPAELAGGEPQPAGARHRAVRQVRAPRAPRGCGWRGALPEMDSRRLNRKGPEGEGRLARCPGAGALPDVRQRSERSDGWRSPSWAPHLPTSHLPPPAVDALAATLRGRAGVLPGGSPSTPASRRCSPCCAPSLARLLSAQSLGGA